MLKYKIHRKTLLLLISTTLLIFSCADNIPKVEYETYQVKKKNLELLITDTGKIGSELEKDVIAPFSTKLDQLLPEGSIVKKGELIGKLATYDEEKEVEKAELANKEGIFDLKIAEINNKKELYRLTKELENAEIDLNIAKIKKIKVSVDKDKLALVTAEETLKTINSQMIISDLDLKEKEKLFKLGYLSEDELTKAKTKVEELKQKKKYTLTNIDVLKKGAFKEQIEKEKTNVNIAKENFKKSKKELGSFKKTSIFSLADSNIKIDKSKEKYNYYTEIVKSGNLSSPLTGLLVYGKMYVGEEEVKIKAGDSIREGATIAKIYDINKPILHLMINEVDIPKVKLNQKVRFNLDSYPEKTFTGVVSFIAPVALKKFEEDLNNVSVFAVTVKINENDKLLKPGMTANTELIAETYQSVITVPSSCIIKEKNQNFCFIKKGSEIIKQSIKTGVSNDLETEIKSGLAENDLIVLNFRDTKLYE